ncbi:hypothetical protein NCHU2750_44380 (plasmid) [Neorhizobium sp. NCHU2750]|nr:hypothetical protein NCHU2750_44380 [Neorhizobium sp. NCHU2750]
MFTRSAMFVGHIHEGRENEFWSIVEAELLPVWRKMPGALTVRLFKPQRIEEGLPDLVLVQEIDYASAEAVAEAERSPVRAEGAPVVAKLMTLFDGQLHHVVYQRVL